MTKEEDKLKEIFVKKYGWRKISGKRLDHSSFDKCFNEGIQDYSYWRNEALDCYINDCIIWANDNNKHDVRLTEDIEDVLDFITDDHSVLFTNWKKEIIEGKSIRDKEKKYIVTQEGEKVHLNKGDKICILPESDHLDLGCCSCGAVHNIDIERDGENIILVFN